jgi:hypothetical protein
VHRSAGQHPCLDLTSSAQSNERLAIAGFVSGGVVAVVATVLFIVSRPQPGSAAAIGPGSVARRAWCGGGPGQLGIACGARF